MATRIVVEWTRSSVRLALAERRGSRMQVTDVRSQPLRSPVEIAQTLNAILKMAKTARAEVVGVVSREQVITRAVKFPATEPAELAQMVELYAKAQLPYPREQTVMDFHVLNQQEGFSTIAIVACQRDVIDRQLALLRDAGLSVGLLTVSSWGVLGWYRQATSVPQRGTRGSQAGMVEEPALVVNVDDTRTDLVLIADRRILSSRSVGQGSQDWGTSADSVELLALEVERSRAAIRKELPGIEVRSLILTGLGALTQWKEPMAQRLRLPVTVIDGGEPFRRPIASLIPPISPVVIGGLACSDVRELLNLSPPDVRVRARHRLQLHELVRVSGLLIGVLVLGIASLGLQFARQRQAARQFDRVLTQFEPMARHVQEHRRTTELVEGWLAGRRRLVSILAEVLRSTPESVTLEWVMLERAKEELALRGNAPTTQGVLAYVKQLEQVQGIHQVDVKYTTARLTPSGERTDFQLILHQQDEQLGEKPSTVHRPQTTFKR